MKASLSFISLSRGFTNSSPTYAFLDMTNGAVSLVGSRYARFASTINTNALGRFTFRVTDNKGYTMSRDVNVRIIAASAPVLGIRNDGGVLKVEVTADPGTSNTIQTTTALNIPWTDWTNLLGNGSMQLLPLNELTNLSPRFFRAYTQ